MFDNDVGLKRGGVGSLAIGGVGFGFYPSRHAAEAFVVTIQFALDVLTKLSVVTAAIGLVMAARTRRQDLRWRKATAARDYLGDIHRHPHSADAVEMIDCILQSRIYTPTVACDGLDEVCESGLRAAFGAAPRGNDPMLQLTAEQASHIRERMDWLLYYMDRIAYLGSQELLDMKDFAAPLAPYSQFVLDNWSECLEVHARRQNYKFLEKQLPEMARVG
jgi:hypothetical protein